MALSLDLGGCEELLSLTLRREAPLHGVSAVSSAVLHSVPPVTPEGMNKATRGVEIASVDEIDTEQLAACMTQITSVPGMGGKKR